MPIAANRSIEKVDNNRQAFKAKVAIRRNVLAEIGAELAKLPTRRRSRRQK